MSVGYDSAKVPEVTARQRPAQARVQGQGRPQRRSDDRQRCGQRGADGRDRQRRVGGRHRPRRRLLLKLKAAGNFVPVDPTPGDHRIRPDARRHRLGLPECGRDQEDPDMEGVRAVQCSRRRLLLPGDQQGRPPPRRRAALAGVPLQRRGPEPLPEGSRPAGACGRDGEGGHRRQGAARRAAPGQRHPRGPDRRAEQEEWRSTSAPTGPRPSAVDRRFSRSGRPGGSAPPGPPRCRRRPAAGPRGWTARPPRPRPGR